MKLYLWIWYNIVIITIKLQCVWVSAVKTGALDMYDTIFMSVKRRGGGRANYCVQIVSANNFNLDNAYLLNFTRKILKNGWMKGQDH